MDTFPEKKLGRLLTLMSELCGILKKENTLLKKQRQSECRDLLEQKTKLSAAYEESFAYFSQRGELLKSLPEKQKRILHKAAVTLGDLTTENARLLKINMEATSRLLNAIVQDVAEQTHAKAPLYTRQGNMEADAGNPAAISFNQVL
ncbi:MAG: hypothetical protein IJ752_00920 [Alphaproteobacteria bacterium]|nr:hypothetical protein [Alphaproteobacteria bacterium]